MLTNLYGVRNRKLITASTIRERDKKNAEYYSGDYFILSSRGGLGGKATTMFKSRAKSSVGFMYRSSGPNTGSNQGGGWILKKSLLCLIAVFLSSGVGSY